MANAIQLAKEVTIQSNHLLNKPHQLKLVGKGRSAFVFKIESEDKVIKVFFPEFHHLAKQEAKIYRQLDDSVYFPKIYETGPNFIIMEYIEGHTFYECLNNGIPITTSMIKKVDKALNHARSKGLNPSDIHLRNLILTISGEVKVIDVVRFSQQKKCYQWDDLKEAHNRFYGRRLSKQKIPKYVIELVALFYKKVYAPFRVKRGGF
ncbi:protein kinase family protein [Alkalihalobacillus sp. AL-G]|uniref:protein kinase family protein n=1 Tax=Alkalihalobacillus sp. AL-G TaxID=2926399 RepID=UPI0027297722|nr:protein kinase family protein [Alkalihalobacillus sp. AL-G]WLD92784.1 protein kinase family protein [Alkalihalobacillus sp. AL-G]